MRVPKKLALLSLFYSSKNLKTFYYRICPFYLNCLLYTTIYIDLSFEFSPMARMMESYTIEVCTGEGGPNTVPYLSSENIVRKYLTYSL